MVSKLPQLRMRFDRYDSLPGVKLPDGYALCTLAERGEDDWIEALNATGDLGCWDRARARDWLCRDRPVVPEGTFIIVFGGEPVATTCTVAPAPEEPRSETGWVSVSPDHQGKGLGYQVVLGALLYGKRIGYPGAYLNTDDWRLPAIKTYLNLGFEPEVSHESHPKRWKSVLAELGWSLPFVGATEGR